MQFNTQIVDLGVEIGLKPFRRSTAEELAKLPTPTICPCCKSAISVKIPIVDLNTNTVSWQGKSTKLRPCGAELLSLLARRSPGMVSHEQIIIHLWGDDEGEDAMATVKVHMCHLRKSVAPMGIGITSIWGSGYKLELAK